MNIKSLSLTYPKSGEKYTIVDKIIIWGSMATLLGSGILILTHLNDIRMIAVGCALAYFSTIFHFPTIIKALRRRIKELQGE